MIVGVLFLCLSAVGAGGAAIGLIQRDALTASLGATGAVGCFGIFLIQLLGA